MAGRGLATILDKSMVIQIAAKPQKCRLLTRSHTNRHYCLRAYCLRCDALTVNDDEHLRQFEDQSCHSTLESSGTSQGCLPVSHPLLVRRGAPPDARGVRAYNAAHGITDSPTGGYHETMTHAWLQLVHTTLRQFGPAASADAFFDATVPTGPEAQSPVVLLPRPPHVSRGQGLLRRTRPGSVTGAALPMIATPSENNFLTLDKSHAVVEMPKHLARAKRFLSERRE